MDQLFLSTVGLGLAYCATPGAVNAEAVRRGLARGFWPALLVQLGALLGDTLWAVVALTGAAVLVQNRTAQIVLGLASACLLLRLGWSALTDAWTGAAPHTRPPRARGAFLTGAVFSLTNPSAVVFWLGIGGGVIATASTHPQSSTAAHFLAGFTLGAVLWCAGSAAVIAWGRRVAGSTMFRWVQALSGAVLAYVGVRTLWRTLGLLRLGRALLG